MNHDLKLILNYLNEKRGFDFSGYLSSMVERRIKQRLPAVRCKDYIEYLNYIQKHADELDNLVDVLTINVSRFFRDTLTFEYIADRILPVIISEKIKINNHSFRVWSAGCSYGEEPYSVAILINEMMKKENLKLNLNIFATDIDEGAIKKAKEATYPFESIKNVKYGLLKEYFIMEGEFHRLSPAVKELVAFSAYDILDAKSYVPPESVFGDFDLVLCRNLLIYFEPRYQDLIFDKLYRAVVKGGYLVLGEAETLPMKYKSYFRAANDCCRIYQRL